MAEAAGSRAPYPGLRSFRREETDLFFGREDLVNSMVDRLAETRFLAVLGSSGTGKSSVVMTGLLDALEIGLMAKAGSRWHVVDFRPGGAPQRNLAQRLLETKDRETPPSEADIDLLRAFLARGPRSVIEWCRDGHLAKGTNLLLLVDQFEELFRYQDYAGREEAEAFVALLLESSRSELPIYVTITMRSEYLGACALIEGLAEAINEGMVLTPRMTREQCRSAIVGPAAVCGIKIEDALVNRLLNDLSNFAPWDEGGGGDQLDRLVRRADQLPLLQYTLNRMWARAREKTDGKPIVLTLDDYSAIGGLSGALNGHADEILKDIGEENRQVVEKVFRALTAGSSIADAVRRPTRFADLVEICGGNEVAVRNIVDRFRTSGVNYLVPELDPAHPRPLGPQTYVDISHESLIRQWKMLSGWLEAEGRAAQWWRRLKEAAEMYRSRQGDLLSGLELDNSVDWRSRVLPTPAWAERYGDDFERVSHFLDESAQAEAARRHAAEAAARRRRQGTFLKIGVAALFILILPLGYLYVSSLIDAFKKTEQQRQIAVQQAAIAQKEREAAQQEREKKERSLNELIDVLLFTQGGDRARTLQARGDWAAAWNLLGTIARDTGIGTRAERKMDPVVFKALQFRMAEQHAAAGRSSYLSFDGEGIDVTQLATVDDSRFGLFSLENKKSGRSTTLMLMDRITGAILFRKELPRGERPNVQAEHYVSADGQQAIMLMESGRLAYWSVADDKIVTGQLDRLPRPRSVSVAFDAFKGKAALLSEVGNRYQFYVWDLKTPTIPQAAASLDLLRQISIFGMGEGVNRIKPDLIGYADDLALVKVSGGVVAVDLRAVTARSLLRSRAFSDARLLPDNRAVMAIVGWDSERGLCDRGGDIYRGAEPSAAPSDCLVAVDVDRERVSGLVGLPPGARIEQIFTLPPGPQNERRFRLIVEAGDARLATTVEGLGPGNYRIMPTASARNETDFLVDDAGIAASLASGGTNPDLLAANWQTGRSPYVIRRTPSQAAWAVLVPSPGKGAVVLAQKVAGVTNPVMLMASAELPVAGRASRIRVFRRELRVDAPSSIDSSLAIERLSGPTPRVMAWSFDFTGKYLLMFNGTRAAAVVDLDAKATSLEWRPLQPIRNECVDGVGLLRNVQPWSRSRPIFIGLDDRNRLWRAEIIPPQAEQKTEDEGTRTVVDHGIKVVLQCLPPLSGQLELLAVDAERGLALVASGPTEVRVLSLDPQQDGAGVRIQIPDRARRAVFTEDGGIAMVLANDNIVLASGSDWSQQRQIRGIGADIGDLAAAGTRLLAVDRQGAAVVLDIDPNRPASDKPIITALGKLPGSPGAGASAPPTGSVVTHVLLPDGLTVAMVGLGFVQQYKLQPLASMDWIAHLMEARALNPDNPSDTQYVETIRNILSRLRDEHETASDFASLDPAGQCRLAAVGLVAQREDEQTKFARSAFLHRRFEVKIAPEVSKILPNCPQGQSARIIWDALGTPPAGAAGWPRQWSALLRASAAGDFVALQALSIALAGRDDREQRELGLAIHEALTNANVGASVDQVNDIASGGVIDDRLRRVAEGRVTDFDPLVHQLLGYQYERAYNDRASLRRALLHFWIAERLYRASGRKDEALMAAKRRVSLAELLPDADVDAIWREANAWGAQAGAAASPVPAVEDDEIARRRRDVANLDVLADRLSSAGTFQLFKAYLLRGIGQAQLQSKNTEAARASFQEAARLIRAVERTSVSPALVLEMSLALARDLQQLGDLQLAQDSIREALSRAVATLPQVFRTSAELQNYSDLLNVFGNFVKTAPPELRTGLDTFKFEMRRFDYGSIGRSDPPRREFARRALIAEDEVLESILKDDSARADLTAQRGTTLFWLGVIASDNADDADKKGDKALTQQLNDEAGSRLAAASALLERAHGLEPKDMEILYRLADSERWQLSFLKKSSDLIEVGKKAARDLETLVAAWRRDEWDPWPNPAGFLSAYARVLLTLSRETMNEAIALTQPESRGAEATIDRVGFDAFRYAAKREAVRKEAKAVEKMRGDSWGPLTDRTIGEAMGFLAGRLRVKAQGKDPVDDCDKLGSSPYDPFRRAEGLTKTNITRQMDKVRTACERAVRQYAYEPRYKFILGRVLSWVPGQRQTSVDRLMEAARGGHIAAIYNLAVYVEDNNVRNSLDALMYDMYDAFSQRTYTTSFSVVYDYYRTRVQDAKDREALQWLAKRAAELGTPEAHLALADDETDLSQRAFHLEIAALLFERDGSAAARAKAVEARAQEEKLALSPEAAAAARREAASWRPMPLIEVPSDLSERISRKNTPVR